MPDQARASGWSPFSEAASLEFFVSADGDPAGTIGPTSSDITDVVFSAPGINDVPPVEYTVNVVGYSSPRSCTVTPIEGGGSGSGEGGG